MLILCGTVDWAWSADDKIKADLKSVECHLLTIPSLQGPQDRGNTTTINWTSGRDSAARGQLLRI